MAAYSFVLARTCTKVNADEAMLTGMMHGIGKLYILTRAVGHPELFASDDVLKDIISAMVPVHRQGDPGELEFLRKDGARGGTGGFWARRSRGTGFDRCRRRRHFDGLGTAPTSPASEKSLKELPAATRLGMNESQDAGRHAGFGRGSHRPEPGPGRLGARTGSLGLSAAFRRERLGHVGHVVRHDAGEIHAAVGGHVDVMLLAQPLHGFRRARRAAKTCRAAFE